MPRAMLIEQLRTLGVAAGQVLLLHASFRAVRPVERGPRGVLDAVFEVLGREGTLVMPSWTGNDEAPFDAATTPVPVDLGALAETFRRMPGVRRSAHPFAFAAWRGAIAQLERDPLLFLHAVEERCAECDEARASAGRQAPERR